MIKEQIKLAQESINQVRSNFNEVSRISDEIQEINEEIPELKRKNFRINRGIGIAIVLLMLASENYSKILFILLFCLFMAFTLYPRLKYKQTFKDRETFYYKNAMEKIKNRLSTLNNKMAKLMEEVEDHFNSDPRIDIVPDKYRYPQAIDFFQDVIEVGRADDMKDAMNLYEEEIKHYRLEAKNDQLINMQMQTFEEARSAKINAGIAAVFSAAAYFDRD